MQIPPTPTFIPSGSIPTPSLNMPQTSMWQFADDAVGWWNFIGGVSAVFQLILLIMILFAGTVLIIRLIKRLNEGNATSET